MPLSPKLSLSFWFTHQNSICISIYPVRASCPVRLILYVPPAPSALSRTCLLPRPPYPPSFDHYNNFFFKNSNHKSLYCVFFSILFFLSLSPDVFLGTVLWNIPRCLPWHCTVEHPHMSSLALYCGTSPDVFLGTALWNIPRCLPWHCTVEHPQMSSLALYCGTSPVHVLPSMRHTEFRNHTKQGAVQQFYCDDRCVYGGCHCCPMQAISTSVLVLN